MGGQGSAVWIVYVIGNIRVMKSQRRRVSFKIAAAPIDGEGGDVDAVIRSFAREKSRKCAGRAPNAAAKVEHLVTRLQTGNLSRKQKVVLSNPNVVALARNIQAARRQRHDCSTRAAENPIPKIKQRIREVRKPLNAHRYGKERIDNTLQSSQ